jgi:protein-tyrosine phosphatase
MQLIYLHFPIVNTFEVYAIETYEVRMWLNEIFRTFENSKLQQPVFIHCLSGKDRTGIVVGIILSFIGIDRQAIIEEYLLSDGETKKEMFVDALEGLKNPEKYFERIKINAVINNLKLWYLY